MNLNQAVKGYRQAGNCTKCFDMKLGILPEGSGCPLPQPRWIGKDYTVVNTRIVVCMTNPGRGREEEREYASILEGFYSGKKLFAHVNAYFAKAMKSWGGGSYLRQIEHWLELDLDRIALMNIALCPMVDKRGNNDYPFQALHQCFADHTLNIMRGLDPHIVILCGLAAHDFAKWITNEMDTKTILAPHYAARTRLKDMQWAYENVRERIRKAEIRSQG